MSKHVCSKVPIFGEIGKLSGHPGGTEKPRTGTGTLRAAQALTGDIKAAQSQHQLGTP